jgi:ABC-type branched-subunit amino acid transport system ATPase component
MTAADGPVLEARGVTVRFGGVHALRDVDLQVGAGEIRGIIGPNGAGKTTLFDCLTGVTRPTDGQVRFRGENVTKRSAVWRSRHGMRRTFQRQQVFGWLSVEDNILSALEWRGGSGGPVADLLRLPPRRHLERSRRERVEDALEVCGLSDVRGTFASQLPIGQARLLEMARAIVDRPDVLLLDEPTSGLAEEESGRLGQLVRSLRDEHACAVLLVEHDVPFVMGLCDAVTVLNLGQVICEGAPNVVMADASVRDAYLG